MHGLFLKMMENAFRTQKVNLKLYDITTWLAITISVVTIITTTITFCPISHKVKETRQ